MLNKKSIVYYIQSQAITAFALEKGVLSLLNIPDSYVYHFQIKNPEGLIALLDEFINNNQFTRKPAIIVLDEDLLYRKTVLLTGVIDAEAEKDKFLQAIPTNKKNLIYRTLKMVNKLDYYAIEKPILNFLITAFTNNKIHIEFTVPAACLFTNIEQAQSDKTYFSKIAANLIKLKKYGYVDFYHSAKSNMGKNIVIALIAGVLSGLILYIFLG